tara:strand:- start:50 stop:289 length:240 start_codon:yes stop_codon:yes gene_type:complete
LPVCHELNVAELSAPPNVRITLHGTQAGAGSIDKDAIEDGSKWRATGKVMGYQFHYRSAESSDSVSQYIEATPIKVSRY